jgi:anthranilate synthase component 1
LVGSSPEVHVKCIDGKIEIRPIAGTRWRGKTQEEDDALAAELSSDPKERAEHIMLVDLARNDVGRVAEFGSVRVNELMIIERYSHVMHIVSNVDGS